MHDLSAIVTLAGALAAALALGWVTQRLRLSTLVGYMLAGIVVGPYTPGFVADVQLASQMAEIGVVLLMFGVGMHFHPQELLRVWRTAVPGAVGQSAVAVVAGWAAARTFGWGHVAGAVFGMALAVASTVVLMRMLVERERLQSRDGHVAVGWLIVEDLFTVAALVVLPALAVEGTEPTALIQALAVAIGKAAVFVALIWAFGTRLMAIAMDRIARTRSNELFTLMVFVIALGVAILASAVFDLSIALGAFFAGMVLGQSRFGPQAAADMMPFRDVFSALFFVSVGMLFNPSLIMSNPLMVLTALGVVLVVKPIVALAIVMLLRDTLRTGLTVAVGLAQIGEFSFILAALGQSLKILPSDGLDVLVVAAIVSIALNPLLFQLLPHLERRFAPGDVPEQGAEEPSPAPPGNTPPVVVTGSAELGRQLIRRCSDNGVPVLVIGHELDVLEGMRMQGIVTVFGDPRREEVLRAAGVDAARLIVVTDASLPDKMSICIAARSVNARIAIIATATGGAERAWLQEFGVAFVCDAAEELSEVLLRSVRALL